MSHEDRRQARLVVNRPLERQQAEHQVEEAGHAPRAATPPRPDLRAHVLDGAQSRFVQGGREAQVEFRRIDADEDVRPELQHRRTDAPAQRQQSRQVVQDLEQAHDRQLLGVREALAAGRLHARPGDAHEARPRRARGDRFDQGSPEVVARGLAGHEADREGTKGTRPFNVGDHVRWKTLSVKGARPLCS